MKKLSLNLDELQVESFSTRGGVKPRGTVNANAATVDEYTCWSCVDPGCTTSQQPYTGMGAGCSEYASCLDGCGGGGSYFSRGDTCGDPTEYNTCTQDYKHCGY
ncbi:hypothetical protein [Longimicrobium sp.]|uniref:hypothetical protein n=1 Tax=Longimicrobium sp. TaxID=2029185 RepID=UPI002BE546B5|nr:hypothetical protein [Longimicrobium sp.]HSU15112.1 hypothetical protein [Longimicrobium sp.]